MLKVESCNYLGNCHGAEGLMVVSFRDEDIADLQGHHEVFLPWLLAAVERYPEPPRIDDDGAEGARG